MKQLLQWSLSGGFMDFYMDVASATVWLHCRLNCTGNKTALAIEEHTALSIVIAIALNCQAGAGVDFYRLGFCFWLCLTALSSLAFASLSTALALTIKLHGPNWHF